ncbi:hypothetical protein A3Q56_03846 [Intoshia linei]|uniref:G patch domain-containing protein n=1 Tax=Intoshia linei TaxID=1819745 RepID=A0A177B2G4_9BILA|nr:hypothetical protein A3Q56_03846 [Intoshia linei]
MTFYGTPLPPNETEQDRRKIERKKTIVTDNKGRQRFHGAFTGGFSAGHFNTVGTKEGWAPGSFKSSRSDRFKDFVSVAPQHYMDDDDYRESGAIALSTQGKYTNLKHPSTKLGSNVFDPVLSSLLTVREVTIGERFLRFIQTSEEDSVNDPSGKNEKIYSCSLPPQIKKDVVSDDLFFIQNLTHKSNFMGIDYTGLSGMSKINDFNDVSIGKSEKSSVFGNNRRGITGEAFGIGALEDEEDDEDIYKTQPLDSYTFSNQGSSEKNIDKDGSFVLIETASFEAERNLYFQSLYPLPEIPKGINLCYNPETDDLIQSYSSLSNRQDIQSLPQSILKKVTPNQTNTFNDDDQTPLYKGDYKISNKRIFVKPSEAIGTSSITDTFKYEAANKNYGALTRKVKEWIPNTTIFARFNIKNVKGKKRDHSSNFNDQFGEFSDQFANVKKKFEASNCNSLKCSVPMHVSLFKLAFFNF